MSSTANYKFSIITVCLNAADVLKETFESIVSQTHKNREWIIVDGGSTDETIQMIHSFESVIPIKWISEKDQGIYNAMNKGLALAGGDVIHFLNAGDAYVNADVLGKVNELIYATDGSVWYGQTISFDPLNARTNPMNLATTDIISLFHTVINHQAIFARSFVFEKFGKFNESYKIYADYEWYLRNYILHEIRPKFIPVDVCTYVRGGYSDRNYDLIGKHELEQIRKNYYKSQYSLLRGFIFKRQFLWITRRVLQIPFIYRGLIKYLQWNLS